VENLASSVSVPYFMSVFRRSYSYRVCQPLFFSHNAPKIILSNHYFLSFAESRKDGNKGIEKAGKYDREEN